MRVLITGGAGFVGSHLAKHFLAGLQPHEVVILDNLHRRGSERNLDILQRQGARFVHGDVRAGADLEALEGVFDVLIEASAEPSVLAGVAGSPRYVIDTNLVGALNCLEFARSRCGGLVFLSTSRIYSIDALLGVPLSRQGTRLDVSADVHGPGLTAAGISESFPCRSHRSFYGGSKLAAEIVCQEYQAGAGLKVIINRCGVVAGPGQFGRTDQGVFTLWVARHHFGRPLKYTGFGGEGLQVRDLLHPKDLCELIDLQLSSWDSISGRIFNVGGGRAGAVSLREFTDICREATGKAVSVASDPETSGVDVPWYITDHGEVSAALGWAPTRAPAVIAADIAAWVRENETELSNLIL